MRLIRLLTRNWGTKLLSLAMAVLLWFFAVGWERGEVSLQVPLEMVNIPSDLAIAREVPEGLSVRIRGSVPLIRQVASRKHRFTLDLAAAKAGPNVFKVVPQALDLPREVEVTHLAPTEITVELERLGLKKVGLMPIIKGEPAAGYLIHEITLEPAAIQIRGPESVLADIDFVWTEPLDVRQLSESTSLSTRPTLPETGLSVVGPAEIKARVEIGEKEVTRTFGGVLIRGLNAAYKFEITPPRLDLWVKGPPGRLTDLAAGQGLVASVDLAGLRPGTYHRRPVVEVPEDLNLVKIRPEEVRIRIRKEK